MHLTTAQWLGRVSLSTAVMVGLFCGTSAAQEVGQPGEAVASADSPPAPIGDPSTVNLVPDSGQPAADSPVATEEKPLEPIPDPLEAGPVEIEVASFKGVTPGVTNMADVEKAWGAPGEIRKHDDLFVHLFSVEPFKHVEVSFFKDKVTAVVIRLDRAFPANAVAQQLELTNIRPVLVSNDLGEILGQVYPERGVAFSFEPSEEPGKVSMKVAQIILEPISAEPFVLRAETHIDTHYELSRRDLEQALKLQSGHARAYWLYSRILVATGDHNKAVTAAGQAVRLEPGNPQYRVTRAQVLGQIGQLAEATQEARKAVEISTKRPHVKARALCLLGDLTASGATPDYRGAIDYHLEAAKTADPLAASPHPAIRLAAKEVLVNAHLGAAHDIAWGNWKEKEQAVTKWLDRADAFAKELVESEGSSLEHRFRVNSRALAACVGVRGGLDPDKWTQAAIRTGEQLIEATDDPLRKAQFQWDLGMALYDTLQVYQMRQDHETALKYGEQAIEYLERGNEPERQSPTADYLLGRLYFRLGAIHAIRDKNYRAAITWFNKAIPLLAKPIPKTALADKGRHGETFVSMGVSYWESGQKELAVQLTQKGVGLMEQAVKQNSLAETALAVPYTNLASMHRQLGRDDAAERFEAMAARIKPTEIR